MKILFQKEGRKISIIDKEQLIFKVDGKFINEAGVEIPEEEDFRKKSDAYDIYDDGQWYEEWMDYSGLEEQLKSESVEEPITEIDDVFGKYGFRNEAGEFVIEPQYAYAYEFTNGLAAVNLNRTWYRTENGKRYYENHYGYIDARGKTVIGFQYDEAYPFNKYGVAVVFDLETGWRLIDQTGAEVPGTRFNYLSHYYEYENRFMEFSHEQRSGEEMVGIYDTKERKIIMEPSVDSIIEWEEDCILVYTRDGEYGVSDFHQYYINSRGEILYPWLYGKGFAIVERPDRNNVAAVAISHYTELTGEPGSFFLHNGKKYDRKFIYGLYSSKGEFLFPVEYEGISKLRDDIWACYKEGVLTVVKTEIGD